MNFCNAAYSFRIVLVASVIVPWQFVLMRQAGETRCDVQFIHIKTPRCNERERERERET